MSYVRCTAGLLLGACLILLTDTPIAADDTNGAWASFYTSGTLNRGENEGAWRYGLYGDARYYDRDHGVNQYVLQPGFGIRANARLSFWGGYTRFHSETDGVTRVNENRLWQQVNWRVAHWRDATLTSRTRLEQRDRNGQHGTDLRLRQQLRVDARFAFNRDLVFILGNEYFYHVRDTGWTHEGYGQNRFYTGLGFDFRSLRIEALYMNQQYPVRHAPDRVNHLVVFNFKS